MKDYKAIMLSRVVKINGCWELYSGRVTVAFKKSMRQARGAYTLFFGEIPDGLEVCHRCDNPRCIKPNHLWLGTHKDNMLDMRKKGRGNPPPYKGKKIPLEVRSKMSKSQRKTWTPERRERYSEMMKGNQFARRRV